ncbi:Glycoside hydrolase, family 79 [Dillenia turbinata]|uniref:Glycoside hydrolase, family 79 n=1 Tax=Dillenia turbinata TaxID=194707 RepID=A0AAN8VCL4_9MAGN
MTGNELSGCGVGTRVEADQYVSHVTQLANITQRVYKGFDTKPLVIPSGGFFHTKWFIQFVDKTEKHYPSMHPSHLQSRPWEATDIQSTARYPEKSKNFSSCMGTWDQLGMASIYDAKTYCGQSLIGGNYGLLSTTTFAPNPDYYSALLWHRLMGRNVLSTSLSGTDKIRANAHCSIQSQGITVLLINLDGNTTTTAEVRVSTENGHVNGSSTQHNISRRTNLVFFPGLPRLVEIQEKYHLTAKDCDLHSRTILLNGKELVLTPSRRNPLVPIEASPSDPINVAPYSIVIAHIPSLSAPACK